MSNKRNRKTEIHRYRDTDDTDGTEDIPRLAASVKTVQEAVQLALKDGLRKDSLFQFARALKAFEITINRRLPSPELDNAFSLWWTEAKPLLPPNVDFDEYRFEFRDSFAKTKAPLGSNFLEQAMRLAKTKPPPSQADRYTSSEIKRLVAVCYYLQRLQGPAPFFLGVRDAARILGLNHDRSALDKANQILHGLAHDGVLNLVEQGKQGGKRASRFRFNPCK
jgi:hypothetical protein